MKLGNEGLARSSYWNRAHDWIGWSEGKNAAKGRKNKQRV